jgi:parallel beta-helix repeat protein
MNLSTRSAGRGRRLAARSLRGLVALALVGGLQSPATPLGGRPPWIVSPFGDPVGATLAADRAFSSADRFVAPSGSDAGPGSLTKPWRTVQHAVDRASATIYLRGGTYPGGVTIRRSGLLLRGFPGETAVLRGGARDLVRFSHVHSGAVRHLVLRDAPEIGGSGVIVASSSNVDIEDDVLRDNRSYGVRTWNSTDVRIANNDIFGNDTGVQISYASSGVVVADNLVHDNDRMIVNTADVYGDDHGAVGIVFLKTSGPTLATGNRVWGNRAASHDYGQDGGAFEVYGASDVTISENVAWDNKDVLETGTSGPPCARLSFVRNLAYGASTLAGWSRGLILACASDALVANNTLDGFDVSAVSVVQDPGNLYLGSVGGLVVENNVLVSDGAPVYHLSHVPDTVRIDRNLIWNRAGRSIAWIAGRGSTSSWATFRAWTGFEATGLNVDPEFDPAAGTNRRPLRTSPAIDRGVRIPGLTEGYLGRGPDLGRWETR